MAFVRSVNISENHVDEYVDIRQMWMRLPGPLEEE